MKLCQLVKQIETLRKEMICVGIQEGLSSEKTVQISQKLDNFIIMFQALYKSE